MGFWRTLDGGRTWKQSFFGPPNIYTTQPVVDPVDGTLYVATLSMGVYKSTDFGDTFARIDRAPGAPPDVFLNIGGRGLTMDLNDHHTLFLAARGAGTWKTVDQGVSWTRVDPTLALSVTVDPSNSNVVYAAGDPSSGDPGVMKSVDGGDIFFASGDGLPRTSQTARTGAIQVDPKHPNELSVGFEGDGVYTSSDAGATWEEASTCLGDSNVQGLTSDPSDSHVLYTATFGSVFRTRRSAESEQYARTEIPERRACRSAK
jgi:hypothetical protein